MRKVFLDDLPKYIEGKNKGKINWELSLGKFVEFDYNGIIGKVQIVDVDKIKRKIKIKYLDKEPYTITIGGLQKCKLGILLGEYSQNNYKYKIGDLIENQRSKIIILEQVKKFRKRGDSEKAYKYKCLKCGNEDIITESSLSRKAGCNVCCNPSRKILKGYNDVATTHPHLVKYFKNIQDAYIYSCYSNKKVDMICPNCKKIKRMAINTLTCFKFSCVCGDSISYPEKIMLDFLTQLKIDFKYQYNPKWCKYTYKNKIRSGKYDFYFKQGGKEYIIEADGKQHKLKGVNSSVFTPLEEQMYIDDCKDNLAKEHDIEVIRIDCEKSELNYIKQNILKSVLGNLFNLRNIRWEKCHEYALSNRVKAVCNLWNEGIHNTKKIAIIEKINRGTVIRWLKQGSKINWCTYNPKEEMVKSGKKFIKKVICINTGIIYNGSTDTYNKLGIKDVSPCCLGKCNTCGIDKRTGEKLYWMFYDEYLKTPYTLEQIKKVKVDKNLVKIICLDTYEIFNSIKEVCEKYKVNRSSITGCCKGEYKTMRGLRWMYYKDYIKQNKLKELHNQELVQAS